MIRDDLVKAISKYMEIDKNGMEIQIMQAAGREPYGKRPVLYASIPVRTLLTKGTYL